MLQSHGISCRKTIGKKRPFRISPLNCGAPPWRQIIAVRNRIVHAYFDLDWQILWITANVDVPELQAQIVEILTMEFSQSQPD